MDSSDILENCRLVARKKNFTENARRLDNRTESIYESHGGKLGTLPITSIYYISARGEELTKSFKQGGKRN